MDKKEKAALFLKLEPEVKAALVQHAKERTIAEKRHVSITELITQWVLSLEVSNISNQ